MSFMGGLFFIIMASILADTMVKMVRARGTGKDASRLRGEVEELTRRLEEQAATLSSQDIQIQELQERLDFAERLMTDARDRRELGPGGQR